jgi:2-polyprenyl-6-hydroxyphenyl methylase/3-demethylubiquinone-9 3-methyltransferase
MVESQRQVPALHKFNPVRLTYIRDHVAAHFGRDPKGDKPFEGLRFSISAAVADCCRADGADGRRGYRRRCIGDQCRSREDPCRPIGVDVDYEATTSEELAARGERFDVVLNMEVVEHVADVDLFLKSCAEMVKPGGLMFVATINRTMKAMALAIIGAEYVLRWLPKGTHQYEKLVRPEEIERPLSTSGMNHRSHRRLLQSVQDQWNLSRDMDVNYMMLAERPQSQSERPRHPASGIWKSFRPESPRPARADLLARSHWHRATLYLRPIDGIGSPSGS